MRSNSTRVLLLPLLATLAACGAGQDPSTLQVVDSRDGALTASNGISLNGISLNGISLNGISLNGISLNGISLNGISLNGISLNGAQIQGVTANGKFVAGKQFTGASLTGVLSDGSTLPMRIDSVSAGSGSNSDVWFYDVSYRSDGSWEPLCGDDANGNPTAAVALAGTWDYSEGTPTGGAWTASSTRFTFGCRLTALAKCVEMGYKPWASKNGTSLRKHHQACTRLLRADYCGNGRPWTLNGRVINLYDGLGVQTDTQSWAFEAEWTDTGARCLTGMRVIDLKNVFGIVDQCVLEKALASVLTCGSKSHFSSGTLLMNEYRDVNLLGLLNL
jgi:hypothetical protein